ncbi:1293_t:CDS:2, partial [Funneliformis geosporum]
MDNEWKNAKLKLEKLFADDEMRGTIKGQLLRIDMKNRLEYFEGSDKEVKASLSTLLLGEHPSKPLRHEHQ